jgi:hypothetical protein
VSFGIEAGDEEGDVVIHYRGLGQNTASVEELIIDNSDIGVGGTFLLDSTRGRWLELTGISQTTGADNPRMGKDVFHDTSIRASRFGCGKKTLSALLMVVLLQSNLRKISGHREHL